MVGKSNKLASHGLNLEGCSMVEITYKCRKCAKMTRHLIRIVTDTLPPNVKVIECSTCGVMGIALIDQKEVD